MNLLELSFNFISLLEQPETILLVSIKEDMKGGKSIVLTSYLSLHGEMSGRVGTRILVS